MDSFSKFSSFSSFKLAFYILIVLVALTLMIYFMLWLKANPVNNQIFKTFSHKGNVTYSYLGKRGDMGNQLFQLACIIAAGKRNNLNIILPTNIATLPLIDLFDLTRFEWQDIPIQQIYHEYDNYELIDIPQDGRNYDIYGYRQCYKYFEDHASEIREIFTPKKSLLNAVKNILPKSYIAIHIRRGDYIKLIHKIPLLREFKECQLTYYKEAIKLMRIKFPNCPLLVCTDSPDWVTPLLSDLDDKAELAPISENISPKFSDFCTLYLADGIIIANSTYSWWAAYLKSNRLVIAPSPWWDPSGLIGTGMGLHGNYLHHPDWTILDADTGEPSLKIADSQGDTLNLYRLIRGMLL